MTTQFQRGSRPRKARVPSQTAFYDALEHRQYSLSRALEIDTFRELMVQSKKITWKEYPEDSDRIKEMLYGLRVISILLEIPQWKLVFIMLSDGMSMFLTKHMPLLRSTIDTKKQNLDIMSSLLDMEEALKPDNMQYVNRLVKEYDKDIMDGIF